MNPDFARIITLQRKERNLSQKQAAEDLGISQALLSHYEKGIRECGLEFLVKAADYYNVSCDYLLGRTPDPSGNRLSTGEVSDGGSDDKTSLSRRIINNSINLLFVLAEKTGSKTLIKELSSSLMLMVYKLFRILHSSNPRNDRKLFRIPELIAGDRADAAIAVSESCIKASAGGLELEGSDCIADPSALHITTKALSEEYAEYSPSVLNLIQQSEDIIAGSRLTDR